MNLCLCVRAQAALEESLIAEEVERLLSEYVEARVRDVLASQHVQASLAQRLQVSTHPASSSSSGGARTAMQPYKGAVSCRQC